jgi:hypothetical protein
VIVLVPLFLKIYTIPAPTTDADGSVIETEVLPIKLYVMGNVPVAKFGIICDVEKFIILNP